MMTICPTQYVGAGCTLDINSLFHKGMRMADSILEIAFKSIERNTKELSTERGKRKAALRAHVYNKARVIALERGCTTYEALCIILSAVNR